MLELTFSTWRSFPCKIHYKAHLFNKPLELGEGALVLVFGNTSNRAAFDSGFASLFSGFGVRKSCSFIFHVAIFLSRPLKEAGLVESCCQTP